MEKIELTRFSRGAGCGCKVAPALLEEILKGNSNAPGSTGALLVGNQTRDDAAVYDIGNGQALISTVDFFAPIVNNAWHYGKIAAANALSDVYAMGGQPFLAIAVMGWPTEKIDSAVAQQVLQGAREICGQAKVVLAGGHTIDAPEPFFGLAVNGLAPITHIKKNSTGRAGDLLYLTKPIGTGVLATALKRGLLAEEEIQQAVDFMRALNTVGAVLGGHDFVHALTDVTGFGLLGHLLEMCEGSGLSAEINYGAVPLMDRVKELTAQFVYADNTMRNWKSYEAKVQGIQGESLLTLCDPQTSGGLLIAIAPEKENEFLKIMQAAGTAVYNIGSLVNKTDKAITIQ